jgi:hypothetical protein
LQAYAQNKESGLVTEQVLLAAMLPKNISRNAEASSITANLPKLDEHQCKFESNIQKRFDESVWKAQNPDKDFNSDKSPQVLAVLEEVEFHTTHKVQTIGDLKPDGVLVPKGGFSPQAIHVVATCEKKSGFSHEFSDESIQQVLDYHYAILSKQTTRRQIFSLLHNAKHVVLIKSFRYAKTDSELNRIMHQISHSVVMHEDAGQELLVNFFSMTLDQHGYDFPSISGYTIKDVLGHGSTSTAYHVTDVSGQNLVAKVYYRPEAEADMKHERDILLKLQLNSVENVPSVKGQAEAISGKEKRHCLILMPVAMHLQPPSVLKEPRSLTLEDVRKMVDVLKQAHSFGFIHRDVRLANLYLLGTGVLVNDWGCACSKVNDAEHQTQYIYIYIYIYMYVCIHTHSLSLPLTQTRINTYIYIYIHTHIHTIYISTYHIPHIIFYPTRTFFHAYNHASPLLLCTLCFCRYVEIAVFAAKRPAAPGNVMFLYLHSQIIFLPKLCAVIFMFTLYKLYACNMIFARMHIYVHNT